MNDNHETSNWRIAFYCQDSNQMHLEWSPPDFHFKIIHCSLLNKITVWINNHYLSLNKQI